MDYNRDLQQRIDTFKNFPTVCLVPSYNFEKEINIDTTSHTCDTASDVVVWRRISNPVRPFRSRYSHVPLQVQVLQSRDSSYVPRSIEEGHILSDKRERLSFRSEPKLHLRNETRVGFSTILPMRPHRWPTNRQDGKPIFHWQTINVDLNGYKMIGLRSSCLV